MDLHIAAAQSRTTDERLERIVALIGCTTSDLDTRSGPLGQAVELLGLFQTLGSDKERQAALAFVRRLASG